MNRLYLLLLCLSLTAKAEEPLWESQSAVQRIALNVALLDFPIEQGQLRSLVGLRGLFPGVGTFDEMRRAVIDYHLTKPGINGEAYFMRLTFTAQSKSDPKVSPEKFLVEKIDIIYRNAEGMDFAQVQYPGWTHHRQDIRQRMAELKLSAKDYCYQIYGDQTRPNQMQELTPDGAAHR